MPDRIPTWRPPGAPTRQQQTQRYDAARANLPHRKLYADVRWRKAAKWQLAVHPLCVDCEAAGFTVLASVCDHIQPHHGDLELFWSSDNWQSLCASCHGKKTRRGE